MKDWGEGYQASGITAYKTLVDETKIRWLLKRLFGLCWDVFCGNQFLRSFLFTVKRSRISLQQKIKVIKAIFF